MRVRQIPSRHAETCPRLQADRLAESSRCSLFTFFGLDQPRFCKAKMNPNLVHGYFRVFPARSRLDDLLYAIQVELKASDLVLHDFFLAPRIKHREIQARDGVDRFPLGLVQTGLSNGDAEACLFAPDGEIGG